MESPDSGLRGDSVEVLGELGYSEAAVPLCRRMTEDKSFMVRRKAMSALVAIGDSKALPSLSIALLEDKNSTIRADAAQTLGKIGDQFSFIHFATHGIFDAENPLSSGLLMAS